MTAIIPKFTDIEHTLKTFQDIKICVNTKSDKKLINLFGLYYTEQTTDDGRHGRQP